MAFADFQALYKQKLTTADEAVKVIKSGDWVDYGFCAIHPRVLDEALARRAPAVSYTHLDVYKRQRLHRHRRGRRARRTDVRGDLWIHWK